MRKILWNFHVVCLNAPNDVRAAVAQKLVADRGIISVQVLNEFAHVVRRKLRWPLPDIVLALAGFRELLDKPLPLTVATHEAALKIAGRDGFSFYDCLIIASALEAGCSLLYSEDMQSGRVVDGRLTIENPFIQG